MFRRLLPLLAIPLLLAACPAETPTLDVEPEDASSLPDVAVMPPRDSGAPKPDVMAPPDPDFANPPEVVSISPKSAYVGTTGPSVIVTGKNFVARTVVQLEGAVLTTSYVSPTELRATIPTTRLLGTGQLRLSVGTAPPGGGVSSIVMFEVLNPPPTLTAITVPSPSSALMGSPAFAMTVSGTGFVFGAKLAFDGLELATTFNDASSLTATVPASKLVRSGTFNVVVKNPAPGGGTSSPIAFVVTNPTVSVSSLSPNATDVGSAATPMVINGAGFIPASAVSFNGTNLTGVTYVNGSQLSVTVPASSLSAVGSFPVVVTNPAPGGGVSAPQMFQVRYPAPTLASIAPNMATAGSPPTVVSFTGTGFYPASEVTFNGAPAATTYVSPTLVKATLTAAQLAAPGSIAARVSNPMPGGGTSTAVAFQISNPAPVLSTVVPARPLYVGGTDTGVTVNGSGFVSTSQVRADGSLLLTTFVSSSQLTATVPASALSAPGNISFTVVNPAPGGGTSNAVAVPVSCDPSGVDVRLSTVGTPVALATNFKVAGAPKQLRFPDNGGSCPMSVGTSLQPYRAVVVQNNSGAAAMLSSWAVCTLVRNGAGVAISADDAFLTFYRGAIVPANPLDREVCTPVVSEGVNGAGAYGSPEGNSAGYCPGLTKANGGAIRLNACERAVVFMQPYDVADTVFTPPTTMKVSLE
jgi:hypothetical protein